MNTKTCEGCGWVYPITHNEPRCRFCGTYFKKRFCSSCGEYKKIIPCRAMCRDCEDALYQNDPIEAGAIKRFTHWLNLIAAVPQPIKTLTTEEWLTTCSYFGKCALCNSGSIDARGFFIPFKLGGRYAVWNVLPLCELCANDIKVQQNPFIHYDTAVAISRNNYNKAAVRNNYKNDNFIKAVGYLKPILEEVSQYGKL